MSQIVKKWRPLSILTILLVAILLCPVRAMALSAAADGFPYDASGDCDANCEGCSLSVRCNITRAPMDNGLNLAIWVSIAVLITGVIALAYYIKHRRKSALH